jgi:tRNA wybutosine-synthesizing protein 4
MQKKCEIVRTTNQLSSIIGFTESAGSNPVDGVLIDCPSYKAVACDLEDATGVSRVLKDKLELGQYPILFLAEVSITYMDAVAAEKLIDWTSTFSDGMICAIDYVHSDSIS